METRKLLLVPILALCFTIVMFVFQMEDSSTWSTSYIKKTNTLSFYMNKNYIQDNYNNPSSQNTTKQKATSKPSNVTTHRTLSRIILFSTATTKSSISSSPSPVLLSTRSSLPQNSISKSLSTSRKPSASLSHGTGKSSSTTSPSPIQSSSLSPSTTIKSPTSVFKWVSTSLQSIPTSLKQILSSSSKISTSALSTHKSVSTISTTVKPTQPIRSKDGRYFLCPPFNGGFGNTLFQFSSTFGIAMAKNMSVIVGSKTELNRAFKLKVDLREDTSACSTVTVRGEKRNCAYDPNVVNFTATKNFRLGSYLQSWKYFYPFRKELRQQLTFQDSIQQEANKTVDDIVKEFNYSREEVTLVAVHVRRGDMVNHSFGYNVATPEYLSKAVQYFQTKYENIIFVISTQDVKWTTKHMPKNITSKYVSHSRRDILVAVLSSCDHAITTVGSFGWWIGWLTGGEVTYFKWPAKEGSALRNQYSNDFSDYFYPGWVGF